MSRLISILIFSLIPVLSPAAERLATPPGCLTFEQVHPDSWLSFLRIQIKALQVNHANAVEMGKPTTSGSEASYINKLTALKTAIVELNCSAYLANQFEVSRNKDLAMVAQAVHISYAQFSEQESAFLERLVSGELLTNSLKRADALSTLAVQADQLGSMVTEGIGMALIELVDMKHPNAENHCDRLVITSTDRDELKKLLSDSFPELNGTDHEKADADIYIRAASLVQSLWTKAYKTADEP